MTIDWFTFSAQIVNFLILVWLLKKFLYGPIVDAMDRREASIQARFATADERVKQADDTRSDYENRLEELSTAEADLREDSRRKVDDWRAEHLQQARDDVDRQRIDWNEGLQREKQSIVRELQSMAVSQSVNLSRHVLNQLADQQLEHHAVDQFLRRVRQMNEDTDGGDVGHRSSRFAPGGDRRATKPKQANVESAFELSENDQAKITDALKAQFEIEDSRFRVNRDLVCGIEVTLDGERFGWSAREALAELDHAFKDSIEQRVPQFTASANSANEASS